MENRSVDPVINWLMAGDPAIRWQTMRDLLNHPADEWQAEQRRTLAEGWGARLLSHQAADGQWGGGLYSPKWISTTYTLLALRGIGISRDCEAARRGAELVLDGILGKRLDQKFQLQLARCDRCIVGMILLLAVYFEIDDGRVQAMVENLLAETMPDCAWNCRRDHRPHPTHSSFHTTFNVLEGLREYAEWRQGALVEEVLKAEQQALEFMLQHRLFRSDKTNEIIHVNFTYFSYPFRWYYDVLRGLSYFARANASRDPRLQDAIDLLHQRQLKDGRWPVQHKHPGRVYFDMEKTGGPSRWNTLRALRVLRWWDGQ